MNIYVGNLSWDTTDDELRSAFAAYGQVTSAQVAMDRAGRARGFGFVEMPNQAEAEAAMSALTPPCSPAALVVGNWLWEAAVLCGAETCF